MSWKSVLEKDSSLKAPWDVARLPATLRAGMQPSSTTESRLRCAHTFRKCVEMASASDKQIIRNMQGVAGVLQYIIGQSDGSASGARLQEHGLMTLVNLIGDERNFDEVLMLDIETVRLIRQCLAEPFVVVVCAAAQLLRRMSEIDYLCHILAFDDGLFLDIVTLIESVTDPRVSTHIMSTLVNMAAHPKIQFMLARCVRIVQWLVDAVFAFTSSLEASSISGGGSRTSSQSRSAASTPGAVVEETAVKSVRVIANLLSNPINRSEIQRIAPSIFDAMMGCQHRSAPLALMEASKVVVRLLHDDPEELQQELLQELSVSRNPNSRR